MVAPVRVGADLVEQGEHRHHRAVAGRLRDQPVQRAVPQLGGIGVVRFEHPPGQVTHPLDIGWAAHGARASAARAGSMHRRASSISARSWSRRRSRRPERRSGRAASPTNVPLPWRRQISPSASSACRPAADRAAPDAQPITQITLGGQATIGAGESLIDQQPQPGAHLGEVLICRSARREVSAIVEPIIIWHDQRRLFAKAVKVRGRVDADEFVLRFRSSF